MDLSELRAQLETHHCASYGWALACCSQDAAEAETVLQNAYLKVLNGKARFDGRASFKTWLFSVIRKTAADEKRWRILRKLKLLKYGEYSAPVHRAGPDEEIYQSEVRALFRSAVVSLPKRQQEVLQLVFYHDLSLQEAAEVMRVSIGSARTHYERGKKRLRELLTEMKAFDESRFGREDNSKIVSGTETGR